MNTTPQHNTAESPSSAHFAYLLEYRAPAALGRLKPPVDFAPNIDIGVEGAPLTGLLGLCSPLNPPE